MPADQDYAGTQYKEYNTMLKQLIAELPPFCAEFFRGIENETLVRTRYAYAGDIKNFFQYLITETQDFRRDQISFLTLSDLDRVSVQVVAI